jgi:hypothetical protein
MDLADLFDVLVTLGGYRPAQMMVSKVARRV